MRQCEDYSVATKSTCSGQGAAWRAPFRPGRLRLPWLSGPQRPPPLPPGSPPCNSRGARARPCPPRCVGWSPALPRDPRRTRPARQGDGGKSHSAAKEPPSRIGASRAGGPPPKCSRRLTFALWASLGPRCTPRCFPTTGRCRSWIASGGPNGYGMR
jgi:hypothetical protein